MIEMALGPGANRRFHLEPSLFRSRTCQVETTSTELSKQGLTGCLRQAERKQETVAFLLSVKRSLSAKGPWEIAVCRGEAMVIQGERVVLSELPPEMLAALSSSQASFRDIITAPLHRLQTTYHDWILQSRRAPRTRPPTSRESGGKSSDVTTPTVKDA